MNQAPHRLGSLPTGIRPDPIYSAEKASVRRGWLDAGAILLAIAAFPSLAVAEPIVIGRSSGAGASAEVSVGNNLPPAVDRSPTIATASQTDSYTPPNAWFTNTASADASSSVSVRATANGGSISISGGVSVSASGGSANALGRVNGHGSVLYDFPAGSGQVNVVWSGSKPDQGLYVTPGAPGIIVASQTYSSFTPNGTVSLSYGLNGALGVSTPWPFLGSESDSRGFSGSMHWSMNGSWPGEKQSKIFVPGGVEDPTIEGGAIVTTDTTGSYLTSYPVGAQGIGTTTPLYTAIEFEPDLLPGDRITWFALDNKFSSFVLSSAPAGSFERFVLSFNGLMREITPEVEFDFLTDVPEGVEKFTLYGYSDSDGRLARSLDVGGFGSELDAAFRFMSEGDTVLVAVVPEPGTAIIAACGMAIVPLVVRQGVAKHRSLRG